MPKDRRYVRAVWKALDIRVDWWRSRLVLRPRRRSGKRAAQNREGRLTGFAPIPRLRALEYGAIAQLGERYNGIVEVAGSIPAGSTTSSPSRHVPIV